MKIFSKLFELTLQWSRHQHAPYYLGAVSFAESSFFPIPPDVMLIPMALAQPKRSWHLALLTTLLSVLGGMFGYLLGWLGIEIIHPYIEKLGYLSLYQQVISWFHVWGAAAILLAGFSPIPYKLFTIGAGAFQMQFGLFVLCSFIGRAGRFFLVAGLIRWKGERIEGLLRQYVDRIGWLICGIIILGCIIYYCKMHDLSAYLSFFHDLKMKL